MLVGLFVCSLGTGFNFVFTVKVGSGISGQTVTGFDTYSYGKFAHAVLNVSFFDFCSNRPDHLQG